jgi:hypothetical protein
MKFGPPRLRGMRAGADDRGRTLRPREGQSLPPARWPSDSEHPDCNSGSGCSSAHSSAYPPLHERSVLGATSMGTHTDMLSLFALVIAIGALLFFVLPKLEEWTDDAPRNR